MKYNSINAMEIFKKEEFLFILSKLNYLSTKVMSLEQENRKLVWDFTTTKSLERKTT